MQKNQENTNNMDAKLPEKNKQSGTILFILIVACWLLLLYFYGGVKGPG